MPKQAHLFTNNRYLPYFSQKYVDNELIKFYPIITSLVNTNINDLDNIVALKSIPSIHHHTYINFH